MRLDEINDAKLDMAYKYSFSSEAKELVSDIDAKFEEKFLKNGKLRLEESIHEPQIKYTKTNLKELKYAYLMSYIYARMLVSAMNNKAAVTKYATAEAKRASEALLQDTPETVMRISDELHAGLKMDGTQFHISFEQFLMLSNKSSNMPLIYQELNKGDVYVGKEKAVRLLETAIKNEITKSLPIPMKELPREVVGYAKGIRIPQQVITGIVKGNTKYAWVERLLSTPIADVRHRTINLILAPYLTNIRGMSEEEATQLIISYIERCKTINPNTKINETYIRYQCRYSKSKGLRPLAFEKAKELLKGVVEFEQ